MNHVLSCPLTTKVFPEGTTDPGYTFLITGTDSAGNPVNLSQSGTAPSATFDLQPGTYTGTVAKLGVSSLPSPSLVVIAPVQVTLSVPDPALPAALV